MRSLVLFVAIAVAAAACAGQRTPAPASRTAVAERGPDPNLVACEAGELGRCMPAVHLLESDAALVADVRTRWKAGCERDDARDCFRLALVLDAAESLVPLQHACQMDLMEGCYLLGVTFEAGESLDPGLGSAAAEVYQKACDGAFVSGCLSLATRLDHTDASAADRQRALQLLDRACQLEEPVGCERAERLRCDLGVGNDCTPPGRR